MLFSKEITILHDVISITNQIQLQSHEVLP